MTKKELKEKVDWTYFAVPNGIDSSAWLSNMLHDYETDDIDGLKRYMYDCGEPRRSYSIIYCCAYDVSDNCTYFGYGKTRQDAIRDLYKQVKRLTTMAKFVKIHKLDKDGCKTVVAYELIGSREDTLRHAVMQLFFKRFDWWSKSYKKAFDSLKIKRMPHTLLWNGCDVYIQVLLEEYDK